MVQAVALAACISSGSTEVVVNQICRMYAAAEQKRHRLRLQPQLSAQPLRRRRRAWPLSCSSARIDILLSFCKSIAPDYLCLQAAAERERQKAQAAATADRAAFEAQEARMAAELQQRTKQERRLLEVAAERARQAAEQRRRYSPSERSLAVIFYRLSCKCHFENLPRIASLLSVKRPRVLL